VKVALDAQLTVGTATGIGEYVRGLIDALRAENVDVIALSEPSQDPWRFDRRVYWDQVLLPQRTRASGADLLHAASGTIPLRVAIPVVVTVHDVAWLRVQQHTRPYARYYFGRFALERYRNAQRIVVDSEFSRGELLEVLDRVDADRISVVYPGVAADFCGVDRRAGDGRTILAVGTVERRKNLELLIRALPSLGNDARIVSVGPPTPYRQECEEMAAMLRVDDRVEFRGYVARNELLELYATAATVAVPSFYEGFGYAAAQALCAGAPCVVSDRSALPEVVAGDARVLPVGDEAAWVEALRAQLRGDDDARASAARAKSIDRFAWPASARAMRDVYEAALSN
jgi:glycosyltransferase involved in cell wall biosynthesis